MQIIILVQAQKLVQIGNAIIHGNPKFCPECGQRLKLVCPDCGTEVKGSAKFCPECGRKLK